MCNYTRTYIYFAIFVKKYLNLAVFYLKNIYFPPFRLHTLKLCDFSPISVMFYEAVECKLQKICLLCLRTKKTKKRI